MALSKKSIVIIVSVTIAVLVITGISLGVVFGMDRRDEAEKLREETELFANENKAEDIYKSVDIGNGQPVIIADTWVDGSSGTGDIEEVITRDNEIDVDLTEYTNPDDYSGEEVLGTVTEVSNSGITNTDIRLILEGNSSDPNSEIMHIMVDPNTLFGVVCERIGDGRVHTFFFDIITNSTTSTGEQSYGFRKVAPEGIDWLQPRVFLLGHYMVGETPSGHCTFFERSTSASTWIENEALKIKKFVPLHLFKLYIDNGKTKETNLYVAGRKHGEAQRVYIYRLERNSKNGSYIWSRVLDHHGQPKQNYDISDIKSDRTGKVYFITRVGEVGYFSLAPKSSENSQIWNPVAVMFGSSSPWLDNNADDTVSNIKDHDVTDLSLLVSTDGTLVYQYGTVFRTRKRTESRVNDVGFVLEKLWARPNDGTEYTLFNEGSQITLETGKKDIQFQMKHRMGALSDLKMLSRIHIGNPNTSDPPVYQQLMIQILPAILPTVELNDGNTITQNYNLLQIETFKDWESTFKYGTACHMFYVGPKRALILYNGPTDGHTLDMMQVSFE